MGFQQADDAIRIADGRNLRRSDNKRMVRAGYGILKALFNACRTVKNDVIKLAFQMLNQFDHLAFIDGCFVPGLGGRKQIQAAVALVLD